MLTIFAAVCKNNALGKNGDMLFYLKDDLARFKRLTMGKKLLMGKKTFDSLPGILPGRMHHVASHTSLHISDKNVIHVTDLYTTLLEFAKLDDEIIIAGGSKIYAISLPYVQKMELTIIDKHPEADVFFPNFDRAKWQMTTRSDTIYDEKSNVYYHYETLVKK